MRRSTLFLLITLTAAAVSAATVDMKDPRRAVGTDDGVRVDAQLLSEFVSPHSSIGVTVQIQNLSSQPIAIADRVCEASFDSDSSTITLSVGSEVPVGGEMPRLVVIHAGEKKTVSAGAAVRWSLRAQRVLRAMLVQIKVNVLRDTTPFVGVSERQKLSDEVFDQWLKLNESIELNPIPVRYRAVEDSREADASRR